MRGSLILLPLAEKEILCKVIFARARGGRSQHLWAEREIRYLWVQLCVRRLYHMILPDTTAAAGQKGTSGFFKKILLQNKPRVNFSLQVSPHEP